MVLRDVRMRLNSFIRLVTAFMLQLEPKGKLLSKFVPPSLLFVDVAEGRSIPLACLPWHVSSACVHGPDAVPTLTAQPMTGHVGN